MSDERTAIGVDLGGTKIEVALIASKGKIIDRKRTPTGKDPDPQEVIENIRKSASELLSQHSGFSPEVLGIGVAGQITSDHAIVNYAPNLNWHNINLGQKLSEALDLPVTVNNDVRAAAYGEWQFGAGKGVSDMLCMFVGTGIGGGIVSGGQLLEGCNNTTGEIGHTVISLDGPECHCGMRGCFEALAGGWALERDARDAVRKHQDGYKEFLELANNNLDNITAKTIADASEKQNPLAKRIISQLEKVLITGVASLVNVIGPCRIVMGGGIIEGFPGLVDTVAENMPKLALKAASEKVEVVRALLGGNSGVIGAAALAVDKKLSITEEKSL